MAFTVSQITNSVFGNMRVLFLDVTTDSTENTFATGLGKVTTFTRFVASGNTESTAAMCPPTAINVGTTATVIAGNIAMTSCANTTTYRFTVYGSA